MSGGSGPRIVTEIPRPDPAEVEALASFPTATVHEAYHRRSPMLRMRAVTPGATVCGPAVTALCPAGDNLMIHAAVEQCRPGDVLVVATTAPSQHGMFGDLLATQCQVRGVAGVVLDAGARDSKEIRGLGYPVWSTAINVAGTVKASPGWVNVPISCDGVAVRPGDVVVADDDGVMVVERADVAWVARAAADRTRYEEDIRSRLLGGESSMDVSDLRALLNRLGVEYVSQSLP